MRYSDRLISLRKNRGLKQSDVAEKIDKSLTAYAYYEQGKTEPSIEVLRKLATFHNVSIDYLVGETDIPYSDDEKEFADQLQSMSLEDVFSKYNLTIDGQSLSEDEVKTAMKLLKALVKE